MVTVKIVRDGKGKICEIHCQGHARYADHGKDIVCASVSTLMQTTVLGLSEVADIPIDLNIDEGALDCVIKAPVSSCQRAKADTILETMLIGLNNIKEQYEKYLDIYDDFEF